MRDQWRCNWLPDPPGDPSWKCDSCLIVDPGSHASNRLLIPFLAAQRRALAQLTLLGVDWTRVHLGVGSRHRQRAMDPTHPPLRFTYRSRLAGDPATIGHLGGLITLDLDEADPAQTEQIRATLGEQYRTPLGHIRHELGHYVWLRYIAGDPARLAEFREVFGDETTDYARAIDDHYNRTDDGSWRADHVSFYASAHPWEDFAESWAQVMHIHDVVSTGAAWGVVDAPVDEFDPEAMAVIGRPGEPRRQRTRPRDGHARSLPVRAVGWCPPTHRVGVAPHPRRHDEKPHLVTAFA